MHIYTHLILLAPRLPSPKFCRPAHADISRGQADYISETMPRACCRRPVVPPPLPAQPCEVAAAAPTVVRRGRRSARCRLLSRTISESARGQPRQADGAIAHVGRLKIGTCSAACIRAASRCNLRRERVRSTARVECVIPLPPATAARDCELIVSQIVSPRIVYLPCRPCVPRVCMLVFASSSNELLP